MDSKLKRKFDPTGFQTEQGGVVHKLTDLSRDDLLQVACECMATLERVDEFQSKFSLTMGALMGDYRRGAITPDPSPLDSAIEQCMAAVEAIDEADFSVGSLMSVKADVEQVIARLKSISGK